jgi:iron complex transport system ATP-binding protein
MSELELRGVTVRVRERTLLSNVDLSLDRGELVALVGPNGAGKTTLLRALLGLVPVATGSVSLGGRAATSLSPRERASALAWLPQVQNTNEPLDAIELVLSARFRFQETRAAARKAAEAALDRTGTRALADAPFSRLSGGERQRVSIAALLAQDARLLLLDEPANHLDPAQQAAIYALLGELVRGGSGVLCVTHDVNLLRYTRCPARVVGLADGERRFELPYDAAALPNELGALFGVRMEAVTLGDARVIVPVAELVPEHAQGAPNAAKRSDRA